MIAGNGIFKLGTSDVTSIYKGSVLQWSLPSDPLNDGNTIAWYIFDEMSTITKDGSDFVSEWRDFLGSGRDISSTAGNTDLNPLWSASGISFNGVFNNLGGTFTLNLPVFIYMVVNVSSAGNEFGRLLGSITSGGPQVFVFNLTTNPTVTANGDSQGFDNSSLIVDSFIVLRVLFNGANSKSIVNELAEATGNTGALNMGGFILGSEQLGYSGSHSQMTVKELVIRNISDVSADESFIFNYLKDKYTL